MQVQLRRYKNIVAFKLPDGSAPAAAKVIGFHSHNLQVAELSHPAWAALSSIDSLDSLNPLEEGENVVVELDAWNSEIDPNSSDANLSAAESPNHLLVNVAQICNLKCDYCAAGGDGTFGEAIQHIDLETIYEQIQMLLHDVSNDDEFTLTFFGGEPLLAVDNIRRLVRFSKLQAAGRNIRLRFRLITNATLVTPAIAEFLASFGCHVVVSIDAPPEINDLARKTKSGKGSSELVLRGLAHLQEVRERLGSLSVSAVFGRHNVDVVKSYRFFRQFSFDFMKFDFAAEKDDAVASRAFAKTLSEAADLAFELGGERELRRFADFEGAFRTLDEQVRRHNHCGAGKSLLTSDGKGRLAACQWFLGKPEDELGQGTNLNHDRLKAYEKPHLEAHGCQSCWARHLCGGGCMYVNSVKSGSKQIKDPAFCDRTKTVLTKAIELYAKARHSSAEGTEHETH